MRCVCCQVTSAVERVLKLLDLTSVADCYVGSEAEPVLSGSEMRRVAIGKGINVDGAFFSMLLYSIRTLTYTVSSPCSLLSL